MKPRSLVDAALLDQEQRILAASPLEFRPGAAAMSKGSIKCQGGCGRGASPANSPTGVYVCRACRVARRAKPLEPNGWTASASPCGPDDVDAR